MDAFHYNYYIYSSSIARIDDNQNAEVKNHTTNSWTKIDNGDFYRRIQEEGVLVTEKEAEEFYNERRRYLSSSKNNSSLKKDHT